MQRVSADLAAFRLRMAACRTSTAQRNDPLGIICRCCAFFQRYNVVRLQVCCGYPAHCQAPAAQPTITLVYLRSCLLPSIAVTYLCLGSSLCLPVWPGRAYIPPWMHPPAPFTASPHLFSFWSLAAYKSSTRLAPALQIHARSAAWRRLLYLRAAVSTGSACTCLHALFVP